MIDIAVAVGRRDILQRCAQRLALLLQAKGITVVLPPNAAERVALSKSSAITMPSPDGWRCGRGCRCHRQHQQALGIDVSAASLRASPIADDAAVLDRDIGLIGVGRAWRRCRCG